MRNVVRLKIETARLVLDFHVVHPDLAPAASAAVARLVALLVQVTEWEEEQLRLVGLVHQAFEDRGRAEEALRSRLTQLVPLCRVVARQEGLTEFACQTRACSGAPHLLAAEAAGVVRRDIQHQEVLQHFGLPPGLLLELTQLLDDYQEAEGRRQTGQAARIALTAAIEAAATAAHDIIHHLDSLNRIRLAADPRRLAEWKAVRVVCRERVLSSDAA
ncbi:MAG: hypothetical protein SGJ01_18840 [Gemmatimonadota bacterium]|nr:hypothetical protein [Gemmatimonadota bacterium]